MESHTEIIKVQLDNGQVIQVEITPLGGEEEVVFDIKPFKEVTNAIEGIVKTISATLQNNGSDKNYAAILPKFTSSS